jgi:choline dehydrogenase-like flavoprotein
VTLDRQDNPIVDYRMTGEVRRSLVKSMRTSARIFFAAGASRVHAPAGRTFFIDASNQAQIDELIPFDGFKTGRVSVSSAHLMGGCRMGERAADSVTDSWGRVHGVPGLFVADASLFPGSAEINPYITIMALADRVAQGVRESLPSLMAHSTPDLEVGPTVQRQ